MYPRYKKGIETLYNFPLVGISIHKDTLEDPLSWLLSEKLFQRFLKLKEDVKEAIRECPYYPCWTEDHACGSYGLPECPFYWAFKHGLVGGRAL